MTAARGEIYRMAIEYTVRFSPDVTLHDGVTLNDGSTVVDKYITRVRAVLIGRDPDRDLEAALDLNLETCNPDQKDPSTFIPYTDIESMPENLKAALLAEAEKAENQAQVSATIESLASSPYGEITNWIEESEAVNPA